MSSTGGTLVNGDAVAYQLDLARIGSRSIALGIDLVVQLAALLIGLTVLGAVLLGSDPAAAHALMLTLTVAVLVGYPTAAETMTRGRTLGKQAMGLRVVRDDGGPVRFRQALIRALAEVFVDVWATAGVVAVTSSLISLRGQRVGDLLAGTVVVRDRIPRPGYVTGQAPRVDPGLAAWAGVASVGLPDRLALDVRQFLMRITALDPQVRAGLAADLARQTAAYVTPAPPSGVPAETFLSTVLAVRSARALSRTARAGTLPAAPVATMPVRRDPPDPETSSSWAAPG